MVLVPSDEFISRLPYGAIPNRQNIRGLSNVEINKYWTQTVQASHELGDCLQEMLESGTVQFS